MIDVSGFRLQFPEFNASAFPDSLVAIWLRFAKTLVSEDQWMEAADIGVGFATAHYLTIAKKNLVTSSSGKVPGQDSGRLSSKTVGPVSASFDTKSSTMDDAGQWNLTTYGIQYYSLARLMGIGVGCAS